MNFLPSNFQNSNIPRTLIHITKFSGLFYVSEFSEICTEFSLLKGIYAHFDSVPYIHMLGLSNPIIFSGLCAICNCAVSNSAL
jgi:hypothetical protein